VLNVINIDMTISPTSGFGMPETSRVRVADVCAFHGTRVSAAVAGPKATAVKSDVRGTDVRGYRVITDVVLAGAFPGTPAWSPPI
jgi:hypothetical protein